MVVIVQLMHPECFWLSLIVQTHWLVNMLGLNQIPPASRMFNNLLRITYVPFCAMVKTWVNFSYWGYVSSRGIIVPIVRIPIMVWMMIPHIPYSGHGTDTNCMQQWHAWPYYLAIIESYQLPQNDYPTTHIEKKTAGNGRKYSGLCTVTRGGVADDALGLLRAATKKSLPFGVFDIDFWPVDHPQNCRIATSTICHAVSVGILAYSVISNKHGHSREYCLQEMTLTHSFSWRPGTKKHHQFVPYGSETWIQHDPTICSSIVSDGVHHKMSQCFFEHLGQS
jgi:hypothetical protein